MSHYSCERCGLRYDDCKCGPLVVEEPTKLRKPPKKMAPVKPAPTPDQIVKDAVALSATGADMTAKALANIADIWFSTYQARLAKDKEAKALKSVEDSAYALMVEQLRKQGLTAIGGVSVRIGMAPEPTYEPHVKDWDKFYAYIIKTKDFSLLERRPGRAAIKERWEDGKEVPGTEKFPVYKLTRNEVK